MTITLDRLTFPATMAEEMYGLTGHRWSEYDSLNGGDLFPQPGSSYSWSAVRPLLSYQAPDLYVIDATSWGEYSGGSSDIQRSNHRALLRDFPDTFVEIGFSGHDGMALALPAGRGVPTLVEDIIRGLDEYPLYDEEDHSALSEEVWQDSRDYVLPDIRQDLERVEFTYEDSTEVVNDEWLWNSYNSHQDVCHWGYQWESADSVIFPKEDHERIMAEVVKDYRVAILNKLLAR
jgi:hypothetical protein